jgi:hypothetical protein
MSEIMIDPPSTSLSTGRTLAGYVSSALTSGFAEPAPFNIGNSNISYAHIIELPVLPVNGRWAGQYKITGTTKNKSSPSNLPVGRRVRLHDQNSGEVVQETWSDEVTGVYSFDYISNGVFYITAFDHTGNYNGVIATGITPTIGAP